MRPKSTTSARWRQLAAAAAVCIAAQFSTGASAQQVLVLVNGDPITTYDVDQRGKFIQISTHKAASRQEVIDELINDKLKVQIAKRYKLDITDKDVDNSFAEVGQRMRMTPQQLTQALAQAGVDANTLKDRLRSDIAWQQIVRGKFQQSLQVRDKDVLDAMASRKVDEKEQDASGFEYTVRPILFVVQDKAEVNVEARKREAEALRARFNNCDEGLPFARALRNVVVRDQIKKTSADLPPPLRKILDDTTIGHLTGPEVTPQGIELFALCARKETTIETSAKRQVRQELFAEQFQAQSKRYLQELRRGAMIEIK
jgi:peptidyl-prolyl cis-trans isomerase SurA